MNTDYNTPGAGGPGLLGTLGPGLPEDAEDTLVLALPRPLPAGTLFSSIIYSDKLLVFLTRGLFNLSVNADCQLPF